MYENILYDVSEGIATVTLNRPDKLNAYTTEMGDEVVDAFAKIRLRCRGSRPWDCSSQANGRRSGAPSQRIIPNRASGANPSCPYF